MPRDLGILEVEDETGSDLVGQVGQFVGSLARLDDIRQVRDSVPAVPDGSRLIEGVVTGLGQGSRGALAGEGDPVFDLAFLDAVSRSGKEAVEGRVGRVLRDQVRQGGTLVKLEGGLERPLALLGLSDVEALVFRRRCAIVWFSSNTDA